MQIALLALVVGLERLPLTRKRGGEWPKEAGSSGDARSRIADAEWLPPHLAHPVHP